MKKGLVIILVLSMLLLSLPAFAEGPGHGKKGSSEPPFGKPITETNPGKNKGPSEGPKHGGTPPGGKSPMEKQYDGPKPGGTPPGGKSPMEKQYEGPKPGGTPPGGKSPMEHQYDGPKPGGNPFDPHPSIPEPARPRGNSRRQHTPSYSVTPANFRAYVKTNGSRLNVRSQPSTHASVKAGLRNGQAVTVTGIYGNWYQISTGGIHGFVAQRYIVTYKPSTKKTSTYASASITRTSTSLSDQFRTMRQITPIAVTVRTTYAGGTVNFRWAPSTNETVIKSVYDGYVMTAIAANSEWVQVLDPLTNQVGFIMRSFLSGI